MIEVKVFSQAYPHRCYNGLLLLCGTIVRDGASTSSFIASGAEMHWRALLIDGEYRGFYDR